MKQWIPTVLAWSLLGCQAEPPAPPPEPDHLAADIGRLGDELLAYKRAENERLRVKQVELEKQSADLDRQIAAYRRLLGDAGFESALHRKPTVKP